MTRPVLTIVAGSNGSGKSTLTELSSSIFQEVPLLDPDAFSQSRQVLAGEQDSDIEAGRQVLRSAEHFLLTRQSFTVETTLSGSTYVRMVLRAKEIGFNVVVFFVGTKSVEINLERVKARVKKGGHDVPESDQHRRFPRTFANMKKLLPLADLAIMFDNSNERGHTLVGFGRPGFMQWIEPVPEWALYVRGSSSSF